MILSISMKISMISILGRSMCLCCTLFLLFLIIEKLLQGFLSDNIGDMLDGIFVLCHFLGKMQHKQIRDIQIINSRWFA